MIRVVELFAGIGSQTQAGNSIVVDVLMAIFEELYLKHPDKKLKQFNLREGGGF